MRRRLLLKRKYNIDNYVFKGICTKPLVNIYWGAGVGPDTIHYADNGDGTYTYYAINVNGAKQWWDRFVWHNSNNVKTLEVNPNVEVFDTRNNRFGSTIIESYNFNGVKVRSKNCSETFYTCHNIETIDVSSWNMVNNTNFYAMFAANVDRTTYTKLKTVKLPANCGTKATSTAKMFAWNRGLENITGMTTVDFSNVTNFSEMFCENIKLKNVDFTIDGWVTSAATDIHSMFLKCTALDFSKIGDFKTWDVSNVTDVSGLFANNNAEYLDLSGWDLRNCSNFQLMFVDDMVNNLKGLVLSNWQMDTTKQAQYGGMFMGCTQLKSITLKGCTTEVVDFFKAKLLNDIFDTVKSGNLLLILDDGTYKYDSGSSSWVVATTS